MYVYQVTFADGGTAIVEAPDRYAAALLAWSLADTWAAVTNVVTLARV